MTLPQLQIIKEIFQGALDCEPDRVSAFLETACQGDKILRHEVEALLTAHQQAGNFIEAPIAGLAANIIQKGQTGLLIGRTIGHYKISKRIDAGGMGEVYLASDITAGRKAAIKLLPAHLTGDAERLMRFAQAEAVKLGETALGSVLGTVSYMSAEQARGAPTDKRTDIWSLGVVLYEMAVGRAPFTGDTSREVMDTILAKEPLPISHYMVQAPDDLQQIITKAVHKNPDERFRNASEMLHALKGLRRKLEFVVELERSAVRRRRWMGSPMTMAFALLVGLLALVFRFYWPRN